jgi:glycerol-3-phosphate dehydrogenase
MTPSTLPAPPLAEVYDVAVIGGGINGVGIAADAAGRGLSVFLCEKDDLASHTSSASSKLIHGGLRYLEHYEFRLVREALAEREVLLAKAPHIVKQMRFVLPHRPHLRPAWMIRAGLFLYDHLGKREKLAGSKSLKFGADSPLKSEITKGFEYSDCWVDDARLVVLNAMAAREKGAHVHTQTRCVSARRSKGLWHLHLERADGSLFSIRAKALVNAAGPWVAKFIKDDLKLDSPYGIRLIQGSHLIVPKLYERAHAHILQNEDQRIVFTIPYLNHFTIIGTTDREYTGDPAKVAITEGETDYLLKVVNAHFKQQLSRDDIVHTYSGVRPLCNDESDNPSAVTRDYTLALSGSGEEAPILSVFGGKLTTYRKLAESALAQLAPYFPAYQAELDRQGQPARRRRHDHAGSPGHRHSQQVRVDPQRDRPPLGDHLWQPHLAPARRRAIAERSGRAHRWRPVHPGSRLPVRRGMGDPGTTSCGAAPSSGCSPPPRSRRTCSFTWSRSNRTAARSKRPDASSPCAERPRGFFMDVLM